MAKCKWIVNDDGSARPFTDDEHAELNKIQVDWCREGQRVLLICSKMINDTDIKGMSTSNLEKHLQATNDFCVLGMLGIIDKPREVRNSFFRFDPQVDILKLDAQKDAFLAYKTLIINFEN